MSAIPAFVPALSLQLRARMTTIGATIRLEIEQLLQRAIKAGHGCSHAMKAVSDGLCWFVTVARPDFGHWHTRVNAYLDTAPRRELYVLAMRKVTDVLFVNQAGGEVVDALGDYLLRLSRILKAMASEENEGRQS